MWYERKAPPGWGAAEVGLKKSPPRRKSDLLGGKEEPPPVPETPEYAPRGASCQQDHAKAEQLEEQRVLPKGTGQLGETLASGE
jgi:hypothetical protein